MVHVVLPICQRAQELEVADDSPMTGHMGQQHTLCTHRIQGRFWWPGLERNIKTYVRCCSECQKKSRTKQKLPMGEMAIMPMSSTGKQCGVQLGKVKVLGIQKMTQPHTKDIRGFLGTTGY